MMFYIPLTPEDEAKLRERAAAEGKDPAAFALEAVQEKIDGGDRSTSPTARAVNRVAWTRFLNGMREWARALPKGHLADDDRESIYEGRGE